MGCYSTTDDELKSLYMQLIEDKDEDLKLAATVALFKNGDTMSTEEINQLLSDLSTRYTLISLLHEIDKLDLVPSKYLEEEALAEAQAYDAFSAPNWYSSSRDYPEKMKLEKIVKEKYEGQVYKFYVYSYFREGYTSRERKIGISNPIPTDSTEIQFYGYPEYSEAEYDSKKLKSITKELTQNWFYRYNYLYSEEEVYYTF